MISEKYIKSDKGNHTMSQYYTSGEFAKKAHVSIRTIRYYDQKNLLKPATHTKGGARLYTDQDFAKLQQILLLKYLGFSLSDIREMTIGSGDKQLLRDSLQIQKRLAVKYYLERPLT